QQAGDDLYWELQGEAPLTRIRCLGSPSLPLRAPLRRNAYWPLISHLCLNHLSIAPQVELPGGLSDEEQKDWRAALTEIAGEGLRALQEILSLYDFSDPEAGQDLTETNRDIVNGIVGIASRRIVDRIGGAIAGGFGRGIEVTLEFDRDKYVGTGVFLVA